MQKCATIGQMLSVFPIQFLVLLAHFLLRLFVGSVVLYLAIFHIRRTFLFLASIELMIAGSILLGACTQLGALGLLLLSGYMLISYTKWDQEVVAGRMSYVLLIGCGLSLFITGAGAFAFDLPM